MIRTVALPFAFAVAACGGDNAPNTNDATDSGASGASTVGIGHECPTEGCAEGQECVTANGADGELSTCEIRCTSDAQCPGALRCNVPPVLPDSLVNVCVE
jgi:hypothetical protein